MVNSLGSYFELNEVGREKRHAFTARHSNSPQAHHPSHYCIDFHKSPCHNIDDCHSKKSLVAEVKVSELDVVSDSEPELERGR
jgi:hypothetical protein